MGNTTLHDAKNNKEDEFYTRLEDIEDELRHYQKYFKNKTIFCNCDDPFESNFVKYFSLNFNNFGLKKLIATSYVDSPIAWGQLSLFDVNTFEEKPHSNKVPCKIEITEVKDYNEDGATDLLDIEYLLMNEKNTLKILDGDGDFRSEESIELLKEADIVVTNPPFSLFREYMAQLIEYDKNFIVIGNQNAINYSAIFELMYNNRVWLGYKSGDMKFKVPDSYPERKTRFWIDENGQKWRSLGNICWFTNLDIQKRHEDLILYKKYNKEIHKKYDNYNAINVNKVAEIPMDYEGVMGVPITFMNKYNPEQFEILGLSQKVGFGLKSNVFYDDYKEVKPNGEFTGSSGKKTNGNPVLEGKPIKGNYYTNGIRTVHSLYGRVFIKNKKVEK